MILSTHLFCLLNLSTTSQFCPPLLLAYTFDVLDLIRQHNQPNTLRYLLCVIYYELYTMHYTLCIIHHALYTMHYVLYTMHYALCIIHYALCIMHYALCTMNYALFTIHYALFTMHYALFTIHYALCTIHYSKFHTYSLFHMEIRLNPVILVLTRRSRRVQ